MSTQTPEIKQKLTLLGYHESLNVKKYSWFKNQVVAKCGISVRTFYNWRNDPSVIGISDQKTINKIAGQTLSYE